MRRLAEFFGLKRNLVILLLTIFVIGAGEELWMRFIPKYLKELGATVLVIGLYDAIRTPPTTPKRSINIPPKTGAIMIGNLLTTD